MAAVNACSYNCFRTGFAFSRLQRFVKRFSHLASTSFRSCSFFLYDQGDYCICIVVANILFVATVRVSILVLRAED